MSGLRALTVSELRGAVRAGELDPADWRARIAAACARENPVLGAFTGSAPSIAELAAGDGPLAGVPVAIKANICARGLRTDCGSRLLADYRAPYDATVVARLRNAGACPAGTTAMDEFGMGSSCEHCAWGPARNPWDPARTPGGSSGGSAAAVAAGLVGFALGSDTGGSVRLPAHCCGLVGLKPTWGRVSRFGLVAFASSLDTIGVLARDVGDTAEILAVIAGPDPLDATSLPARPGNYSAAVRRSARGLRVGVPRDLLEIELDPDVRTDFELALRDLVGAGVVLVDQQWPEAADAVEVYTVVACAEAASNLARFDGSLYGSRQAGEGYRDAVRTTRTAGFGREVKRRILVGNAVLSTGYRDRWYERARYAVNRLGEACGRLFAGVDAVVLPTAAEPAFPLGSRLADPVAMYRTDRFTTPASLAGLPALTVPTGLSREGLPLSVQLIGPALGEETLLTLGAALEVARDFRRRKEAPWHRPL